MEGKGRIGDTRSSLLDEFERASFQARLNQAVLGRSFSEPHGSSQNRLRPPAIAVQDHPRQSKKLVPNALKKLLKPIFRRKEQTSKEEKVVCPRQSLADLLALEF
ncbi:hypothetical protein H6P81_008101 [Aristolochia fimbriata]|uniref:Uncharacterized protein n=1 Tax=Aristolochia fimbriata TaxID=158543 RepID=A0AAV7F287_ARIFI|nr:hypothetical protein H6P81_008101 [Aristolochia fimbriata]